MPLFTKCEEYTTIRDLVKGVYPTSTNLKRVRTSRS